MNARYAYCGLVDDFAVRHKDGQTIERVSQLNDHLIRSVFAGDRLIINDGYLLMNPAIQQAILNPGQSPFCNLVKSEFITIVSRNAGNLTELCKLMADNGITSAKNMLKDPFYTYQLGPALQRWSDDVDGSNWWRSWPAHRTDYVYGKLSTQILDSLIAANPHDRSLKQFRDELGVDGIRSRTTWEDAATRLYAKDQLTPAKKTRLMAAANEAYQYAWGCNLSDKNYPTSVQSRASQFLGGLNLTAGEVSSRARPGVTVFVPNVEIAAKGIHADWELLAQIASPASPITAVKRKFREDLEKYYTGQGITQTQMQASAKEYSKSLATVFGNPEKAKKGVDIFFGVVTVGAAAATAIASLAAAPAIAIATGIAVAGIAVPNSKPGRNLITRLGQKKPHKWIDELQQLDTQKCVSSFELDPVKAAATVEGLPRFKS